MPYINLQVALQQYKMLTQSESTCMSRTTRSTPPVDFPRVGGAGFLLGWASSRLPLEGGRGKGKGDWTPGGCCNQTLHNICDGSALNLDNCEAALWLTQGFHPSLVEWTSGTSHASEPPSFPNLPEPPSLSPHAGRSSPFDERCQFRAMFALSRSCITGAVWTTVLIAVLIS
jgi:hypothetical protein